MPHIFDSIIVGAGWAGAVAARELSRAGRRVLVLEARDRVGGRAQTWTVGKRSVPVDLGCAWVHGWEEGTPVRRILEELKHDAVVPKAALTVVYGPEGRIEEQGYEMQHALGAARTMYTSPYPSPTLDTSLASALFSADSPLTGATESDTALAHSFARLLEAPFGIPLEQMSLRYAGWEAGMAHSGTDAYPLRGYQKSVRAVLDDAVEHGAEINLGEPVSEIKNASKPVDSLMKREQDNPEYALSVSTTKGKYASRSVLSTIPLGVLKHSPALFDPPLAPRMRDTIAGTAVGTLEKLALRYDKTWWPNEYETTFVFLPTARGPLASDASIAEILAHSTIAVANFGARSMVVPSPTLVAYLSHTPATHLANHSTPDVVTAFHAFLQERFGCGGPAPVHSARTDWANDPYARGSASSPTIVSPNGERSPMDFVELARSHWSGRLGFAGEHTDPVHRGSVNGAVISGLREAERVGRWLDKYADREERARPRAWRHHLNGP